MSICWIRLDLAKKSEKNSKGEKIYRHENHLDKNLCFAERGSCRETESSSTWKLSSRTSNDNQTFIPQKETNLEPDASSDEMEIKSFVQKYCRDIFGFTTGFHVSRFFNEGWKTFFVTSHNRDLFSKTLLFRLVVDTSSASFTSAVPTTIRLSTTL